MSDHLFGSITMPPELRQLVEFHRFGIDRGAGSATMLSGWRAFLDHQRSSGPIEFLSTAAEHLEHFDDLVAGAVEELIGSRWSEVVALGLAVDALRVDQPQGAGGMRADQPQLLVDINDCSAVQASVRDESQHGGPTPWIVEVDFGRGTTSSVNVWINPDGSLYQLYPSDEPIEELEEFLGDINHLVPNRPFTRVPPTVALDALRSPAEHTETGVGDRALLQWLRRTPIAPPPEVSRPTSA